MLDLQLQRDVLDELLNDKRIDAAHLTVTTDGGKVTLSGRVGTYGEKSDASDAAWRVTGVRAVDNQIEVDTSTEGLHDADLAASATAALDANSLVPTHSILVSAEDGWLTLSGNVRHHFQRQAAVHVMNHLRGIRGFSNLVTVTQEPARDVTKKITSSLRRSAALDAEKITVSDVDGAVHLIGSVRSFAERQEAERAPWQAQGVVSVTNELVVTS
jgi:osmotically-inducible protein OsmY